MISRETAMLTLRSSAPTLLPLLLWLMLLLSLQAGTIGSIFNPGSALQFVHGLRAVFPLAAGALAGAIIRSS